MVNGHVAVVSEVVSKREILIDHANWAPLSTAGRGKVTTNVRVLDVSKNNDWSELRVWHGPAGEFGSRIYPAYGFIYGKEAAKAKAAKAPRPDSEPRQTVIRKVTGETCTPEGGSLSAFSLEDVLRKKRFDEAMQVVWHEPTAEFPAQ